MKDGPRIASVAALLGDPARANILTALMDGRALTVSELAHISGVTIQTASGHLSKLSAANLVVAEKLGRHRYIRLSDPDVAQVLEALMGLAQRTSAKRVQTGPKDAALRAARVCYDHLAGERGVELLNGLTRRNYLTLEPSVAVTRRGSAFFTAFGVDVTALQHGRRVVCRTCLDWSERRNHLGGALGAALLREMISRRWLKRSETRAVSFSATGDRAFRDAFCVPDKIG